MGQCFTKCCSACWEQLKEVFEKPSERMARKQERVSSPPVGAGGVPVISSSAKGAPVMSTFTVVDGDEPRKLSEVASDEEQSLEDSGSGSREESSEKEGTSEGESSSESREGKPQRASQEGRPQSIQGNGFQWKSCADAPVRMKNAQAVFLDGEIHVGGGYTGMADTDRVVFKYDPNFNLWGSLPACPMKWFGLAVFGEQLVAVGGKEVEVRGMSTNKVTVWDKDSSSWTRPFPPMIAARTSPTVFSHKSYLVVAGGKRGVLDYNVEILDGGTVKWFQAPPLPLQCFQFTSLVHHEKLYLLGERENAVLSVDIGTLVKHAKEYADQPSLEEEWIWDRLPNLPVKAFRITSVADCIVVFAHSASGQTMDVYVYAAASSKPWEKISLHLSTFSANATSIVTPKGRLYLIGGDSADFQYSNKIFRLSVQETPYLKSKHLHVQRTVMF